MQFVGLVAAYAGTALPLGVLDDGANALIKEWAKITQPYQGGVSTNFSMPSSTEFFRENEADPFYSVVDPASATKELTWEVADMDDATMEFYFGKDEPKEGKIYEGESGFAFVSKSGMTLAFARLKYTAILTGSMNSTEPLRIRVSAKVLAPANGGAAWWPLEGDLFATV